ncbi:sulfite exporter TauE/SafE family protein [candidate division KSB1 bacterium]
MEIQQYILVFLVTTFAGMYGLIFGGGSFLTLPTLFLMGVDPKIAIATNQLGAIGQMLTGSWIFIKKKKVYKDIVTWAAPAFLVGTLIGVFVLIQIDGELIKKAVSIMIIFFAGLTLFKNPEKLPLSEVKNEKKILGVFFVILLGVYSMVITASTGTMLTFVLMYLFGLKFKRAIENRQPIALIGVSIATAILWIKGYVDPLLAIPLFTGRAFGAYIGANIVLHARSHFLRVAFSIVIIGLALKTLFF